MIRYFQITLLLLITFFVAVSAYSQWEWIHPTPTGTVYRWCKLWDANTFYVAGNSGTFLKTADGGQTWFVNTRAGVQSYEGAIYKDIYGAYFFDQNSGIIVGLAGGKKTTDGGENFIDIPELMSVSQLYDIYFLNNTSGYVCGTGGFLSKTTDGGTTWNTISSAPAQTYYSVCSPDGLNIYAGSFSGNVSISTNAGVNWTQVNVGTTANINDINFINKDTGFVAGSPTTFMLTTNGGTNWVNRIPPVSGSWYEIKFRFNPNLEIYTSGTNDYQVLKSTDLGVTWDSLKVYSESQNYFGNLLSFDVISTGDTVLVAGSYGVLNIRKGASNITSLTKSVRQGAPANNGIWVEGNKIWAVGSPQEVNVTFDQILYSSDRGNNWTYQSTGDVGVELFDIKMLDENTGYIVGDSGVVMKTVNGGINWNRTTSPTPLRLRSVSFPNPSIGWVLGEQDALYKTTDGGENWTHQISEIFNFGFSIKGVINMLDENTGWAVGNDQSDNPVVCKTSNGGINWIRQDANIPQLNKLTNIKMLNANIGYFCGYKFIRKTTNGGANWNSIPNPFSFDAQFLGMDFIDANTGVITCFGGAIHTFDGGQTWIISDGFLSGNNPQVYMVSRDTLFTTALYSAVYKRDDILTGIGTQWTAEVPEDYVLKQNYPNPFNPSTTIEFAIPRAGKVTLKVYDISGREVKTLVSGLGLNSGIIRHTFDGSNFASGVYFYSLIIDNNIIETKKMVLVK